MMFSCKRYLALTVIKDTQYGRHRYYLRNIDNFTSIQCICIIIRGSLFTNLQTNKHVRFVRISKFIDNVVFLLLMTC